MFVTRSFRAKCTSNSMHLICMRPWHSLGLSDDGICFLPLWLWISVFRRGAAGINTLHEQTFHLDVLIENAGPRRATYLKWNVDHRSHHAIFNYPGSQVDISYYHWDGLILPVDRCLWSSINLNTNTNFAFLLILICLIVLSDRIDGFVQSLSNSHHMFACLDLLGPSRKVSTYVLRV